MSETATFIKDKSDNFPNSWKVSVDKNSIFTNDDVIDAFLKGKDVGAKDKKQIFVDKLTENIVKSAQFTNSMLTFLKKKTFNPISAHLKINAYNDFVVLVTVPEAEFISEKFLVAYNFAANIENEVMSDKYYNVMFMFSDREEDNFNKHILVSEGFFMDYNISKVGG